MERIACERECLWRYRSVDVGSELDDLSRHIDSTLPHLVSIINCEYHNRTGGATQYSTDDDLADISKYTHIVRLSLGHRIPLLPIVYGGSQGHVKAREACKH